MNCSRTIRVGDIRITSLCDAQVDLSVWNDLPAPTEGWRSLYDRYPWAFSGPTLWRIHCHAFLVQTPDDIVVVDTGPGPRARLDRWLKWGFPSSWTGAIVQRSETMSSIITPAPVDLIARSGIRRQQRPRRDPVHR